MAKKSMSTGSTRCKLDGKFWVVDGDPHVKHRLVTCFPLAERGKDGLIRVPATDAQANELMWFRQRYPMAVDPEGEMRKSAAQYRLRQSKAEAILSKEFTAKPVDFADGLAPRWYQSQAAELWKSVGGLLLADDLGLGKAQPLSSKVLTVSGWVSMGEIRVGDMVVDPDGGHGEVTGVYERGVRNSYKVTTRDGRFACCCDEHLWMVLTSNDRSRGGSRVLSLKEIMSQGVSRVYGKEPVKLSRFFLPLAQPYDPQNPVSWEYSPYLIGALLGDGNLKRNAILFSCYDDFVLEKFRSLLAGRFVLNKIKDVRDYRVTKVRRGKRHDLIEFLRLYGLMGKRAWEKSLPSDWSRLTVNDRTELLKGLMDTDGTVGKDGSSVTFTTTSEALCDDVRLLVESLGGFASKYSRVCNYTYKGVRKAGRRCYTLNIRVSFNPFSTPRKSSRFRLGNMARPIVSIEHCGTEEMRCISVSTKRNLYITDGSIVTHNTISTLAAITDPALRPCVVVLPSNLDRQWVRVAKRFVPSLTSHIIKSMDPYELACLATCPVCEQMLDTQYQKICPKCRFKPQNYRQVADLILCSYGKLKEWPDYLAQVCKSVVFEEAHSLRRDESEKWAAASVLASQVEYRLGLTATPIFNLGGEIWNIMECIAPGFLGPKASFKKSFCGYSTNGKEPPLNDPDAMGSYLRESNVMLRRTSEQAGVKKGECNIIPYEIDASAESFSKHAGRAHELAKLILNEHKMERGRAMQIASDFDRELRKATGLAKAPMVASFVEMLVEQGIPALVFGWHHECHDLIMEKLKDYSPVKFTGEQSKSQKDAAFEKFTRGAADGGTDVMLCSLWAGEGLDGLQHRCCTTVFAELDWSWARMLQCIGRIARDGQTRPVNAYIMRSEFGLDPVMSDVLGIKEGQLLSLTGESQIGPARKIDQRQALRDVAIKYSLGRI